MTCYVYHIHTEGMGLGEGYIGVSVNPKARWAEHKRRKENPYLRNAINKHEVKFDIISVHDTVEDALWQEFTLRPFGRMGWNLVKGGGKPPEMGGWNKGQSASQKTRQKQSEARKGKYGGDNHPRAKKADIYCAKTNSVVAKDVVISVWAKSNGFHQGHLSATARGKLEQHKGLYARYT